jgi:hypothetical protein
MSIGVLLGILNTQEPTEIVANHLFIGDMSESYAPLNVEHYPLFTVRYPGFVEVEFVLDRACSRVIRFTVRQSAMSLSEWQVNGEVLPSLTVDCNVLRPEDRMRLDWHASVFVEKGKLLDKERGEDLLALYASKALFNPRSYGETSRCLT